MDGIDVWEGNDTIDWTKAAAAGVKFAYVRGAFNARADRQAVTNVKKARAAGIKVGLYHFVRPGAMAVQLERFQAVLSEAEIQPGDLIPVVDVENVGAWRDKDTDAYIAGVRAWIDAMEDRYAKPPALYTRATFWEQIGSPSGFADCPLWVAHYKTSGQPNLPKGWTDYAFWQYSEHGSVPGVPGDVDLNRMGAGGNLASFLI